MNLEFKEIINDEEWDSYVQSLSNYSFLNSSARYRYQKGQGISSFRHTIMDGNKFIGIMSISIGHSKLFGNFLECKHSPILSNSTEENWSAILSFCQKLAKKYKCFFIRFSPLYEQDDPLLNFYNKNHFIQAPIHNVDALISQQIDLTKDMEELRREMSKTKRNLLNRLLEDQDISVKIFNDESQFELFKDFHNQTVKLKGYTDKPVNLIIEELREQVKNQMCIMLVGYFKKKPVGIWQCTIYGKHIHLYQAAGDSKFRDKNINISYILFWEALKLGKEKGCKVFDLFGGVVPKEYEEKKHPWRGVNDFKRSLGGEKVTYMHSRDFVMSKSKYYIYYIYSTFRTRLKGHTTKW